MFDCHVWVAEDTAMYWLEFPPLPSPRDIQTQSPGFRNSWCTTGQGPEPNGAERSLLQILIRKWCKAWRKWEDRQGVFHIFIGESGHSCSLAFEIMRRLDHFEGMEYLDVFRRRRSKSDRDLHERLHKDASRWGPASTGFNLSGTVACR